jgi:DNA-binding beta-propeller fold protein YncE
MTAESNGVPQPPPAATPYPSLHRACGTPFETTLLRPPGRRSPASERYGSRHLRRILRRVVIGGLGVLAIVLVVALVFVAFLTFPATPKDGASLRFAGFVTLPKGAGGPVTVMDYLTVDGAKLYVTSESSGNVYAVPLSAGPLPLPGSIAISQGAGAAHGVVVDPLSRRAFVTRSDADNVDVFDPATGVIFKHIEVAPDVDGMIFDPADKLLYAVSGDPHLATLIDPATAAVVGTIPLGGQPEFAVFDPQTRLIYQNLTDIDAVAVVDVARRAVVERWSIKPCRGPSGIALDDAGRRLFVVCKDNALLVVVDLSSHRIVASLAIGGGPDSVAYDPALRRIYATGKSGVLTVTQQDGPNSYRALDSIKLHFGAHTLAVDPATHRVYVAYASLIVDPRLAVFDARP